MRKFCRMSKQVSEIWYISSRTSNYSVNSTFERNTVQQYETYPPKDGFLTKDPSLCER